MTQVYPSIQLSHGKAEKLFGFECFWLMYVNGFDPTQHCKRCLRGTTSRIIRPRMRIGEGVIHKLDEAKQDFHAIYLCGVSAHFIWHRNLHLVFVPEAGSCIRHVAYNGIEILIGNARAVQFKPLPDNWRGLDKSYTTCRNYQFGVDFYGVDGNERANLAVYRANTPQTRLFTQF